LSPSRLLGFCITIVVIIIADITSKTMLSAESAGKAILRHFMVIEPQPPIRKLGTARAIMLARNVPIIF
jgi:hypothetical protein